ncbi:MarR family transcriptional regulator [Actinomadura sp. NBRC 104412]|uniref:GNAT family N-acetyltransferase n=1 Tax=Actinomadura sp. NBRC 104412 TaxID=3032203 RepID=UPI0024A13A63|nr:GNAT family N-acetyltransferase [Actinomadura sp. NBRC 104412]GLZ06021.1 MarR family transcriptional regulator [Actinomadura sp. NBRC 104412]
MRTTERTQATLRRLGEPGDLGWVVMAHGELYATEYGWNTDFEALVGRIVADYAGEGGDERRAAWIAELDGRRVGCVFCVPAGEEDGKTAKLRLLLVDPSARGNGIGSRLVEECLNYAKEAGYRDITLWTNDVLVSARRIYQAHGFQLVDEEPHHSFGKDLVGQNWSRPL